MARKELKAIPRRAKAPCRLVLDTSVFTNPEVYKAFGDSPTEALKAFLPLAAKAGGVEVFMPTSIYNELMNFVEPTRLPQDLQFIIKRKSPKKYAMTVPAFLLYELIHDVRVRVDKGLRVAEEAVRTSHKAPHPETIATLRRKYREALRDGIIDSKEDVELILLAMELDGVVVTADKGIISWVEKLGIRWMDAGNLKGVMEALVHEGRAF